MAVDWDKPIQTRDGRAARFLCELRGRRAGGFRMSHVVVVEGEHHESLLRVAHDGSASCDGSIRGDDIINVPPRQVRWVNLYPNMKFDRVHDSRERADSTAHSARIACIRIEFEQGEGLTNDPA